jgi:phosphate uptake regulator
MSLISGSYSRLLWTGGAALLRDDMVEKAVAVVVRKVTEFDWEVRRAIGLTALLRTLDR